MSFWGILVLTTGAVLAYPVLNTILKTDVPVPETEDLSVEREKVLDLLGEGKITPEESTELLNALSESAHVNAPPRNLDACKRMLIIGGFLVLIGFLLPWYSISPFQELNRLMGKTINMSNNLPKTSAVSLPNLPFRGHSINLQAWDTRNPYGWIVLLIGAGAAVMPFVAGKADPKALYKITLIGLGIGSFILIYLLVGGFRYISVGIFVVMLGYAFEFMGTTRGLRHDLPE